MQVAKVSPRSGLGYLARPADPDRVSLDLNKGLDRVVRKNEGAQVRGLATEDSAEVETEVETEVEVETGTVV